MSSVGVGHRPGSRAAYLAKLWTLFGAPDEVSEGCAHYGVLDRQTGQRFNISVDVLGISYGAVYRTAPAILEPMLASFDALLAVTPLAECELVIEDGTATITLGAKSGRAFER